MNVRTTPAVDFDALVARNRELISKLPEQPANSRYWIQNHGYVYSYAIPSTNY